MDPSSSRNIGKYTSLALLLPISTVIGYAMGYGLDYLFHIHWLRFVFLALGTVSGFISLIRELDKDK
jgi:F0F1-type ATP synthase assembly protein I